MSARALLLVALALACPVAASAAPARHAAPRHAHAPAHPARRAAARDSSRVATRDGERPRMLQDIPIEGEIPVPQVLFITARDQRRFLEFQQKRFLRSSREVGEATAAPAWLVVTETPQRPKEAAR